MEPNVADTIDHRMELPVDIYTYLAAKWGLERQDAKAEVYRVLYSA